MRRRFISVLLSVAFILGTIPVLRMTTAADTGTAVKGEYTYSLSADPDTGTVPSGFGTVENNGRIWTDKSVAVNGDHFDVNLKVLAQEYISTYGTAETSSIAADVLMIFDMTTSMNTSLPGSGNRLEGLVDAANVAIDIITNTNPNNRINIYNYGGTSSTATVNEILPLAHYTSTSTAEGTADKYLVYSSNTIRLSSTLQKDGEAYNPSPNSFSEIRGTGTQYGIAKSTERFLENINNETDNTIKRKPYVILMTDGEPTWVGKKWYTDDASELRTGTITSTSGGDRNELMALATILTAAYNRDKIEEAYTAYNNGAQSEVEWFNIGLGIEEPTDADSASYTACMLDPNFLLNAEPVKKADGGTTAEVIKYYLTQPDWAPAYTEKDYSADNNYFYINEGDGYVTFANTYAVLMNAFTTLAEIIQQGSQQYTIPIVNHEGSGENSTDVVFTDVIGEGMYVTDVTLKPDKAQPVTGVDDGNGNYTFQGYSTTVTVTEDGNGQQTLVWNIPANEVAMFTFADRENVTNGEYISADPTVLTYGIDFSNDIEEGPAYTNAFDDNGNPLTTVTYEIPGDNDYYFDVVHDDLHNFVSSTMKTDNDEITPKTDNTTQSATDSSSYVYTAYNDGTENSSAAVQGKLGNNGKASFLSRKNEIEITVEKKWEDSTGTPIDNTSSLPIVTVTLYRMADDSDVEETVKYIQLSNSNGYSETNTLPVRDENDKRYTYYIKEDCPDGYYISEISAPLRAMDGTLSVTNTEFPDEGVVAVKKVWRNKVGGAVDAASMPAVQMQLKRHVTKTLPATHTVTVTLSGDNGSGTIYTFPVQTVDSGSTISFTVRGYIRRQNAAQNASIKLNNATVSSSYGQDYYYTDPVNQTGRISNNRFYYRETATQTFVVTEDLNLNYTCSATLNTSTITGYDPCQLLNISVTPPDNPIGEPEEYDEDYETITLNNRNGWTKVFENLTLSEFDLDTGATYTYKYFIEEISDIPGFTVSYSDNNTDGITGGVLTVSNTSTANIPVLPQTGGGGSHRVVLTGVCVTVMAAAVLFYGFIPVGRKKRRYAD